MVEAITTCRSCGSNELDEFLDLGEQYLSDFRKDDTKTPLYPLVALFCHVCKLVQLKHTTPQYEMYHDRYGFKSGISESIKDDLDDNVRHAFQYKNDPKTWLDIASNDGTLLSFVPADVYRVGVDPVGFLCEQAKSKADLIINNFFAADLFTDYNPMDGHMENWQFDVITSISCFYDMPDPNKFVADVASVLDRRGIWDIQQNYLLTTMELSAVDNFCHEHIEYYTLRSLEYLLKRHGLEVNEVVVTPVNGGSIRTIVSHKGAFPIDESVQRQRDIEEDFALDEFEAYENFAENVMKEIDRLRRLLLDLKDEGKSVYILAASTRGATIWQSAEIGPDLVVAAVERNPAKVGANFTAIGVPIISEEEFRRIQPDYAVVGPWFFIDELIDREAEYLKKGGHLIVPLPNVEVIGWQD